MSARGGRGRYFAEAKLSRTRSRDEAADALSEMLADASLEADQKAELAMKAAELSQSIEIEGKIENLIKAKGFDECMVYYDTDRVDIVVKTEGLTDEEVMQMRDIAIRETSVQWRTFPSSKSQTKMVQRAGHWPSPFYSFWSEYLPTVHRIFLFYRLRNTKNMV